MLKNLILVAVFAFSALAFASEQTQSYRYEPNFRVKCKYADAGDAIIWEAHAYSYSDAMSMAYDCCGYRGAIKANIYNSSGDKIEQVHCR